MSGWRKRQIVDLGSISWRQRYKLEPMRIARALVDRNFEVPEPEITDFTLARELIEQIKNRR